MLNVKTGTVRDTKLRMLEEDFFYFNQTAISQLRGKPTIFALGKDHIHTVACDLSEVGIFRNDGDYCEEAGGQ